MPELPGRVYGLGVCNDPCTIAGFREQLTGEISIVETAREAELLNERQHLMGKNYSLEREVRKLQRANDDLSSRVQGSGQREADLSTELGRLRNALADRRAAEQPGSAPWLPVGIAIVVLVLVGIVGILSRKRRRRVQVHDVPAMVEEPEPSERPMEGSFR